MEISSQREVVDTTEEVRREFTCERMLCALLTNAARSWVPRDRWDTLDRSEVVESKSGESEWHPSNGTLGRLGSMISLSKKTGLGASESTRSCRK
jgi:hypothetical protein